MGDQDIVAQLRDPNYAGCMQHLRSYDEIDRLFNASADLIESLRSDLARIAKEREEDRKRHFEQAAQVADEIPMFTDGEKYSPGTEQNCFEAGQDEASRRIAAAIRQMGEMP